MENTQDQIAQEPSANLTLADITLALQIIQVAAQRNAFKAEEYEEIGGCYNRILGFLEASGAVQRTASAGQTTSQEPAADDKSTQAVAKTAAPKKAAAKKPAAKTKGKK